jgi:hypothetical protein
MDYDQQGNEIHHLTGRNLNSSIPSRQRDEWWIRWPASIIHGISVTLTPRGRKGIRQTTKKRLSDLVWEWMVGDIFHLFLVFVPFAIAAGCRDWGQKTTFAFGIAALIGLESASSSSMERLCLPLGQQAGLFGAEVISNITPTTVSVPSNCFNCHVAFRND